MGEMMDMGGGVDVSGQARAATTLTSEIALQKNGNRRKAEIGVCKDEERKRRPLTGLGRGGCD